MVGVYSPRKLAFVLVSSSRTTFGFGDLWIVKELYRRFSFLFVFRDGCGLLDPFGDFPSATNNVKPALRGAAAVTRRRHGLKVKDEGQIKNFNVIFIVLTASCN
jgi:hypothetical protein